MEPYRWDLFCIKKEKNEKINDPCIGRRNNKNHVDSCFSHSFASLFIKDNFLMLPETRQA